MFSTSRGQSKQLIFNLHKASVNPIDRLTERHVSLVGEGHANLLYRLAAPPPLPRAARVLVADALRSAATDAPAALPRPRAVVTPRARPAAGRLSSSPFL